MADLLEKLRTRWFLAALLAFTPTLIAAQSQDSAGGHADPVTPIILGLAIILAAAKFGGHLAARIGQPAVLGELVAGVVLGNSELIGIGWFRAIETDATVDILARLGVIILLFEVGLSRRYPTWSRWGSLLYW